MGLTWLVEDDNGKMTINPDTVRSFTELMVVTRRFLLQQVELEKETHGMLGEDTVEMLVLCDRTTLNVEELFGEIVPSFDWPKFLTDCGVMKDFRWQTLLENKRRENRLRDSA